MSPIRAIVIAVALVLFGVGTGFAAEGDRVGVGVNQPLRIAPEQAAGTPARGDAPGAPDAAQVVASAKTFGFFALASLAPAAVLMVTAFVRINIVLILLRQALGSPQVPGNQVLTALALLLTALVMRPVADVVYTRAIKPYAEGRATAAV